MKATTWLCPVLVLLCATRLVCTAQRSNGGGGGSSSAYAGYGYAGYPLDYVDANFLQDDYLLEKRNKPSLSIVNPLDVLRQRLLLEIARRQMKENTRQVELNRAILKNVGKRSLAMPAARRYQMSTPQQSVGEDTTAHLFPYQLDMDAASSDTADDDYDNARAAASIREYLQQRPAAAAAAYLYEAALDDENKALAGTGGGVTTGTSPNKHQINGNEIGNETANHNGNDHNTNNNNNNYNSGVLGGLVGDGGTLGGGGGGTSSASHAGSTLRRTLSQLDDVQNGNGGHMSSINNANLDNGAADVADVSRELDGLGGGGGGGGNAGLRQLQYLYRLHKNHFAKK